MKKNTLYAGLVACSMALVVGLAGCSSSGSSDASSTASTSAAAASAAAASAASTAGNDASTSAAGTEESGEAAEMANPWHDAASAEEAAEGAGLDSFALPEGEIADLGEPIEITYQYMDGMAQARFEFPASAVTARTATLAEGELFDISGDYTTYANEWTEYVDNIPVACAGNREGESTKTYWGEERIAHSLVAEGLGGDEDFGLTAERLVVFVGAMN